MFTKEDAKRLQKGDFIPRGERISDISQITFRRTKDHEIYLCCAQTNYDIQSGPIYCGDVAEFIAFRENGHYIALCGKRGHKPTQLEE